MPRHRNSDQKQPSGSPRHTNLCLCEAPFAYAKLPLPRRKASSLDRIRAFCPFSSKISIKTKQYHNNSQTQLKLTKNTFIRIFPTQT